MIRSLDIQGFGSIQKRLRLRDLTEVNYFVGINGSGKSSILQAIFLGIYPDLKFPTYKRAHSNFDIRADYFPKNCLFFGQDILNFLELNKPKAQSIETQIEVIKKFNYLDWNLWRTSLSLKSPNLFLRTLTKLKEYKIPLPELLLIENPEHFLHPSLCKGLAEEFSRISKSGIQVMVSTHSPFIISASGELMETKKESQTKSNKKFYPSQKVYLIKKGQTTSKSGKKGKGYDGYWGKKMSYVAGKMLGAGLSDFITKTEPTYTDYAPIIIFCEGEGKSEDSRVYNTIFADLEPRTVFVSSKGHTQAEVSLDLINEIKNGISGNFHVLMLRDRDHDFPTTKSLQFYRDKYPHRRVLSLRALECYLYNSETAKLLIEKAIRDNPETKLAKPNLSKKVLQRLDALNQRIKTEVSQSKKGNSYKQRLLKAFEPVFYKYQNFYRDRSSTYEELCFEIAKLIKPGTKNYSLLHQDIFSS